VLVLDPLDELDVEPLELTLPLDDDEVEEDDDTLPLDEEDEETSPLEEE